METPIYGIIVDGVHHDVSRTLHGAKCYATRNGFESVSKRIGYNAMVIGNKVNGKWDMYPLPF